LIAAVNLEPLESRCPRPPAQLHLGRPRDRLVGDQDIGPEPVLNQGGHLGDVRLEVGDGERL
jgi:hypothetical protein